jgi:hypothetical protein
LLIPVILGQGKTIHSSGQLESFKNVVDDQSQKIGGKQHISTPDGYFTPLNIIQGLPYFLLRPPSDLELNKLPHIVLTLDTDWEPSSLDNDIDPTSSEWYSSIPYTYPYDAHPFNHHGEYIHREFNVLLSQNHKSVIFKTLQLKTIFQAYYTT